MKLEFCWFSKNTQTSNSMKIRPVGSELFHADRRTEMTKIIVAFRNFANAPKKIKGRTRFKWVLTKTFYILAVNDKSKEWMVMRLD
jgi:hypothetical protein